MTVTEHCASPIPDDQDATADDDATYQFVTVVLNGMIVGFAVTFVTHGITKMHRHTKYLTDIDWYCTDCVLYTSSLLLFLPYRVGSYVHMYCHYTIMVFVFSRP